MNLLEPNLTTSHSAPSEVYLHKREQTAQQHKTFESGRGMEWVLRSLSPETLLSMPRGICTTTCVSLPEEIGHHPQQARAKTGQRHPQIVSCVSCLHLCIFSDWSTEQGTCPPRTGTCHVSSKLSTEIVRAFTSRFHVQDIFCVLLLFLMVSPVFFSCCFFHVVTRSLSFLSLSFKVMHVVFDVLSFVLFCFMFLWFSMFSFSSKHMNIFLRQISFRFFF